MRRLAVIVLVFGAALGLLGCKDSVVFSGGQGETADGFFRVDNLLALSGPSGEHAGGRVLIEQRVDTRMGPAYVQLGGPVTCLAVQGSTAVINFDEQLALVGVLTFVVHDGSPDTFAAAGVGRAPTDCSLPSVTGQPLTSGQISIVDSQPPPPTR
jgi:hypothetical protein